MTPCSRKINKVPIFWIQISYLGHNKKYEVSHKKITFPVTILCA